MNEQSDYWKKLDFRNREWNPEAYYHPTDPGDLMIVLDDTFKKTRDGDNIPIYELNPTQIARMALYHLPILRVGAETRVYDIESGLWDSSGAALSRWLQMLYNNIFDYFLESKKGAFAAAYSPNKCFKNAIEEIGRCAPILDTEKYMFDASFRSNLKGAIEGLPFRNGIIRFEDGNVILEPYTPFWLFTKKVMRDYDDNADPNNSISILEQWMPDTYEGESRYLQLLQVLSQAFVQQSTQTPMKKAYFAVGGGNSAKTTFGKAIFQLLGKEFASMTKIDRFTGSFGKSCLPGKMVNFGDETRAKVASDIDELKDIIGSTYSEINAKNKQQEVKTTLAVNYFTGNAMLCSNKAALKDDAYLRRWNILHFVVEFETDPLWERDHFTDDFFKSLLKVSLEFAAKIHKDRKLPFNMTADEVRREFSVNVDIVEQCLREYTEKMPENIPIEKAKETGYFIPVEEMKDFFNLLYVNWDRVIGNKITDFDNTGGEARKGLPRDPLSITESMRIAGYKNKQKVFLGRDIDGKQIRPYAYLGLKFNVSGQYLLKQKF